MRIFALIMSCLLLNACAASYESPQAYLAKKGITSPTPDNFQHCHAYGCKKISQVTLTKAEWAAIDKTFRPRSKTAEQERERIAKAIGQFEKYAGIYTGTEEDHYGTFKKLGDYQHDCVDESTNTTIYMSLLQQKGLMRFHTPAAPEVRLPIIHAGRWPHQTATMLETATGEKYAVDSWFHDNGYPAEIIPIETWKHGWKPEEHRTNSPDTEKE